jgi:hypothetical protein
MLVMSMIIESIRPELVGGKSTLAACLRAESGSRGWPEAAREALLATVPPPLLACECFHDKLTGLWRYEFGEPHRVRSELVWGTHMWSPVPVLLDVLACARQRLPPQKLAAYLALLGNPAKHQEYLAEMLPMFRVDPAIPAEHEARLMGAGNKTIDWLVGPVDGRRVLFDVKRRFADFIAMMDGLSADDAAAPGHDVGLLFRSVEGKFRHSNPDQLLQGAWIVTDIKQDEAELGGTFAALDAGKVHFAVLGDAEADVHVITRRPEDRGFLLRLFQANESTRFVFDRAQVR